MDRPNPIFHLISCPSAFHMSPSNAVTFAMNAYTPPGFNAAIPLDTTGDPCGTYKLSGTYSECLLA